MEKYQSIRDKLVKALNVSKFPPQTLKAWQPFVESVLSDEELDNIASAELSYEEPVLFAWLESVLFESGKYTRDSLLYKEICDLRLFYLPS